MSFIDLVLSARTLADLGVDYREASRLIHPDVCDDPRATEAFVKLTKLRYPTAVTIESPLGRVTVGDKLTDHLFSLPVLPGLLQVRKDRNKAAFSDEGDTWTLRWQQFKIRKGTEHFPAAVAKFPDDASDLVHLAPLVHRLPLDHAMWVLRRCLFAFGNSKLVGPFEAVFIGTSSRAWVWSETTDDRKEAYKRSLQLICAPHPLVQGWVNGAVHADPQTALRYLDKLIDANMVRQYTPLDITTL